MSSVTGPLMIERQGCFRAGGNAAWLLLRGHRCRRKRLDKANGRLRRLVAAFRAAGGDVNFLSLPDIKMANLHFAMLERNNVAVADTMSEFLRRKQLD